MIAAVRLGLRLAGVNSAAGSGRVRSMLVMLAGVVGTVLMLAVLAIGHAESARSDHGLISDSGMSLVLSTVVITVALPVLVLAATAGRLASAMRDRRLANLRLLGMSAAHTRIVAAVETGAAATVGALVGLPVFLGIRQMLAVWDPAGRDWTTAALTPTMAGYFVVLLAVPAAVTLVSASPRRRATHGAISAARRGESQRPGWWRLIPLLAGFGLAIYVFVAADPERGIDRLTPYMFAAIIGLGLGMVLIVPVFVRLVADVLVRAGAHPTFVIAGRRLQDQPATTSRLVAGLLIGLFIVTGARAVVVAFEQTPQYQSAVAMETSGEIATFNTTADRAPSIQRTLEDLQSVRTTVALPVLDQPCPGGTDCMTAVVSSCAQLADLLGSVPDCRDDEPAWLYGGAGSHGPELTFYAQEESGLASKGGQSVTVPTPTYRLPDRVAAVLKADVFLPRSTLGIGPLLPDTAAHVLAVAPPGVDLTPQTLPRDLSSFSVPDLSYYDFVAGLRSVVWAVAAVVLSIGLLGFAIGAVDRALTRRGELVALQLVGVSPRILRRTQWIEIALPLLAGLTLAIGLGALAGACYLDFGNEASAIPWRQTLMLAGVSTGAATIVAAFTVIAASPRIRPELIRTE